MRYLKKIEYEDLIGYCDSEYYDSDIRLYRNKFSLIHAFAYDIDDLVKFGYNIDFSILFDRYMRCDI